MSSALFFHYEHRDKIFKSFFFFLIQVFSSLGYFTSCELKGTQFDHLFLQLELHIIPPTSGSFLTFGVAHAFCFFLSFWLCWVFVAAFLQLQRTGAALHRSTRVSLCYGFSCCGARSCDSRTLQSTGSVVVVNGLSCSSVCGIFLDQGWNPCPVHWQVNSLPLSHQGSPSYAF